MPVDALLLEASCVAQEASITGESVPQAKIAIERPPMDDDDERVLNMEGEDRASVLFAGTSIVHCHNDDDDSSSNSPYPPLPAELSSSPPPKCLVLRTGPDSSRGKLSTRTNGGGGGTMTTVEEERDSLRLIAGLTLCAAFSCASVFLGPPPAKTTSTFRRIMQCTRILTSTIPTDIPSAVSFLTGGRERWSCRVAAAEVAVLLF